MQVASDVVLDSAVFQVSSANNRYEAIACSKGNTELIASGPVDLLVLHLEDAKKIHSCSSNGTFKLQLTGDGQGSSWFTKSTLKRFLDIINSSDMSKSVNGVLDEMSQLEETRKFHQSLYIKEQPTFASGTATGGLFGTGAIAQQGNVGSNSSEATKTSFNFGYFSFASWFMRCMLLISDYQPPELPLQQASTGDNIKKGENAPKIHDMSPKTNIERTISNKVSPAKLAQVERESSSESDDSSESSDEGAEVVERSRPLVRSASPRRSASPMRRVQIGRSGSRRSTAITIKSLSYFPPSQRISLDKDDEISTSNGETDQPPRKSDNNVRRMSVQDAISLFENKQKDQNPDSQKQKAGLFATKSVLRRWSAGMGDSLNNKSEETISESTPENKSNNMISDTEKNQVEMESEPDRSLSSAVTPEVEGLALHADCHDLKESETESDMPSGIYAERTKSGQEESSGRAITSAEWNRQKEAELNQMLMKMMEVMPGKFAGANITGSELKATNQKKDGSHVQRREKPETKVRTDKGIRRTTKESSIKLSKETGGLNKSATTKKTGTVTDKRISPAPQKTRRNSSPPVVPKEVASKTSARKSSPKPSPAPATRSSWSGGSLTKSTTSTAQKAKTTPGMASTSTPTSRRRTSAAPSSSQPTSKVERNLQPVKNKRETATATKPTIEVSEEKKAKTVAKTSRVSKVSPASEDKSSVTVKRSLQNKVSKKSSVVPLESKSLKKPTGISQNVGSGPAKSKVPQLDNSTKESGTVNHAEDKEQASVTTEPTIKVLEADLAQPAHDVDEHLEISLNNDLNIEKTEKPASSMSATEMDSSDPIEPSTPTPAPPPDEDMDISSAAWVEVEHQEQEATDASETVVAEDVSSPGIAPLPSSSPRIHHSLSQMLQADSNEPEIIEWGNAENPPAIVFHKDSPKGFKRLLKFARKNKGDSNSNGWASPSVVSEGEDELDESRGTSDGANSSRRTFDGSKTNSILSGTSLNHIQCKFI
ncbi:hypothetical protein PR202_gb19783 [Eleusine coracana subsp. coracana]|uniref:Uncharacterized protein n=1 Tax=Eleusine coracana subsp. coracana TaxID=191504 RepID=A0AAV5FAJ7_ELECO|nr:hypothetical protein PR202_gb19783 [Eleusine coracana subsp. coracana]